MLKIRFFEGLSEVCSLLVMSSCDLFTVHVLPGCISSHKNTSPIGLEPHSMISFNLSYLLKGFVSKIVTLGVRASTYVLGGVLIQIISHGILGTECCSTLQKMFSLYLIVAFKFCFRNHLLSTHVSQVRIILFLSLRRRISYIQAFYSSSQCDHLGSRLVTQARPVSWNYYWSKLKEDFYPF